MEGKTQISLSERIYALIAIGYILGLFPICTIFYLHGVGIFYWIFGLIGMYLLTVIVLNYINHKRNTAGNNG